MKNLFEPSTAAEVKQRLEHLGPESQRQWGKMTAPQAMAHCSAAMQWAVGDTSAPRVFIGRIIGSMVKPMLLGDDKPMRRNAPTAKTLVMAHECDLARERERLRELIDRFAAAGPQGCTKNPHSFFGRLTPQEWATLMYKHLDHHLRQFGV
ncbi:MAG TPA: DUF1569 domain-containing protein [Terracidiphilus sp.]